MPSAGPSTKIADFQYSAGVYTIVGWKDDDELYFFRGEDVSQIYMSTGPLIYFTLDVDTGDVTEVDLPFLDGVGFTYLSDQSLFVVRDADELRLIRSDGTTLFSQIEPPGDFRYSGALGVVGYRWYPYENDAVLTFVDLESGTVLREIEVTTGERYVFIPYGDGRW